MLDEFLSNVEFAKMSNTSGIPSEGSMLSTAFWVKLTQKIQKA